MFAIVDVSNRSTRGQILMLLDDQETAGEMALELSRRAVPVVVRAISAEDIDHIRLNISAVA